MLFIKRVCLLVSVIPFALPALAQDGVIQEQVIEERPQFDPFLQEKSIETLTLEDLADPNFDPNQLQSDTDQFTTTNEQFPSNEIQTLVDDTLVPVEDTLIPADELGIDDPTLIPEDELSVEELDRLLGNEPPAGGFEQQVIETQTLDDTLDQVEVDPNPEPPSDFQDPDQQVVDGTGAILRGLDTLNGTVRDFTIDVAQTLEFERLQFTLYACRYPEGDIQGEAYAYLRIRDKRETTDRFSGWMLASSPALSALDHPRYDIWVLSCKTD